MEDKQGLPFLDELVKVAARESRLKDAREKEECLKLSETYKSYVRLSAFMAIVQILMAFVMMDAIVAVFGLLTAGIGFLFIRLVKRFALLSIAFSNFEEAWAIIENTPGDIELHKRTFDIAHEKNKEIGVY